VVAVVTREDSVVGRKRLLTPSAVATTALELGIPLIKTNRINETVDQSISKFSPDLGVVVAFGAILKFETLSIPKFGWINVHYSLLPRWRGASPVQSAILSGDSTTGVTIFQLNEGLDTGPVWGSLSTPIAPLENSGELLTRLTTLSISLLLEMLPKIFSQTSSPTQQVGEASYAPKISRQDMKLSFDFDAKHLERIIRAANPEPVAWCNFGNQPIQILEGAEFVPSFDQTNQFESQLGKVFLNGERVLVAAAENTFLEIILVKPSGKGLISGINWYRGAGRNVVLS
jgi:methionyl-tRNA formyltransferase